MRLFARVSSLIRSPALTSPPPQTQVGATGPCPGLGKSHDETVNAFPTPSFQQSIRLDQDLGPLKVLGGEAEPSTLLSLPSSAPRPDAFSLLLPLRFGEHCPGAGVFPKHQPASYAPHAAAGSFPPGKWSYQGSQRIRSFLLLLRVSRGAGAANGNVNVRPVHRPMPCSMTAVYPQSIPENDRGCE